MLGHSSCVCCWLVVFSHPSLSVGQACQFASVYSNQLVQSVQPGSCEDCVGEPAEHGPFCVRVHHKVPRNDRGAGCMALNPLLLHGLCASCVSMWWALEVSANQTGVLTAAQPIWSVGAPFILDLYHFSRSM